MPEYPDRMDNLKNFLRQTTLMNIPDFRNASQIYEAWKLRSYEKTPKVVRLTPAKLFSEK
jgi:hypothetical protein